MSEGGREREREREIIVNKKNVLRTVSTTPLERPGESPRPRSEPPSLCVCVCVCVSVYPPHPPPAWYNRHAIMIAFLGPCGACLSLDCH